MKTKTRRLIYTLLLLLAVAGVLALILMKGPLAPLVVQSVPVRQGDLHPALFGIGTVEARRAYSIGPTRAGRLLELRVDHGDRVARGQLLGRMDPVDLPARLQAAALSADKLEHQVEAAKAKVKAARSRYRLASKEARRYRELVAKGQISREAADARETEARTRADEVKEAEADLAGARHDLERSRAEMRAVRAQLDDLELRSPADALVTAREVEPGSVVVGGTAILRLIDPASLWVRTRIEQRDGLGLATGLSASIELRQRPGRPLAGRVARLELIADDLTEERWVDVAFTAPAKGPAVGSLANVTIHLPVVKGARWLPAAAVHTRRGETGIWVVRDGRVHFQPVRVGARTLDGKVQILSGLPSGATVAGHSLRPLAEGRRVEVAHK